MDVLFWGKKDPDPDSLEMLDQDQDQHSINPVPQHWVEHFIVNVHDTGEFLPSIADIGELSSLG